MGGRSGSLGRKPSSRMTGWRSSRRQRSALRMSPLEKEEGKVGTKETKESGNLDKETPDGYYAVQKAKS
jgi:hypothetical protein